jgi:hypothetical protein
VIDLALVHRDAKPATRIPAPPPSSRRALPMLATGAGERRDECREYAGCLDRWVRRHGRRGGDLDASCPPDCTSFTTEGRELELLHAASARPGSFTA